jgi:hypothetical protein
MALNLDIISTYVTYIIYHYATYIIYHTSHNEVTVKHV